MEQKIEKPTDGSFSVDIKVGYALVKRYFAFGQTEISFSAVVRDPLEKSTIELHRESVKTVIAYLQGLLKDQAPSE